MGTTRTCRWRVDKGAIADSYFLTVNLFKGVGIDDIRAEGEIEKMSVGSHSAARSVRPGGAGCVISLGVTKSTRVDVVAVGGDVNKLCEPALAAARLVEPKLP